MKAKIWIVCIVLAALLLGGCATQDEVNRAYDRGYDAAKQEYGYDKRDLQGEYDRGYEAGHEAGYEAGREDGFSSGESNTYDQAYYSGYEDGYEEGYRDAINDYGIEP